MELTTKFDDIKKELKGPVDDLVLLYVISDLCTYAFQKHNRSREINLISGTRRIIGGLSEFDKEIFRNAVLEAKKSYLQNGVKLGNEGRDLLKVANAMNACIIILDSDAEEWKKSLKTKLLETKSTLKKMLKKIKSKDNSNHEISKVSRKASMRFHQQKNQPRQSVQLESTTDNTKEHMQNNF